MAASAGQPTLADITAHSADSIRLLVEQFLRSSFLLQRLPFDNSVTPNASTGILAYPYARTATQRSAQFRDWYQDYPPEKASTEPVTTQLRPFGGAHEIDRVFADADRLRNNRPQFGSYVEFQTAELVKAAGQKFHDTVINGDSSVNPFSFDGLSKILEGSTSEVNGASLDMSAPGADKINYWQVVQALQKYVNRVRQAGLQPVIFTNEDGASVLSAIGTQLGYRSAGTGAFGETVDRFAGVEIVDLGVRPGTAGESVIPTTSGLTDIYVVGLGLAGFHGVTLDGDSGMKYYSNLFDKNPGVTKRFEAEMVATVAVKNTRAAWVLRDVRAQPAAV